MIELVPAERDDEGFLAMVQRIMNGAIVDLQMPEVFLVHVDNWFDHKWFRWWSPNNAELRIPTFTPNRILSEKHFILNAETSAWVAATLPRPLHLYQPGRPTRAQSVRRFSDSAAFVWYSGNSTFNKGGSLMLYVSGAEGYSWYASFRKGKEWSIADGRQISRRGLLEFEERGRQLELANR
jgi:hypothetical protein